MRPTKLAAWAVATLVVGCGARSPVELETFASDASTTRVDAGHRGDAASTDASLPFACVPGEGSTRVGTNVEFVRDFRVDDAYVYAAVDLHAAGTRLYRVPKQGGDPLVFDEVDGTIRSLALSADEIFWTMWRSEAPFDGEVRARRIDGSTPMRTVARGLYTPSAVAVRGTIVYVGGGDAPMVSIPRAGGAATPFPSTLRTSRIIANDSMLFMDDARGIASVGTDGSQFTVILPFAHAFDADATTLFFPAWIDDAHTIARRERIGGPILEIAQASTQLLSVDEVDVYWFDARGLVSAPKTGGAARVVSAGATSDTSGAMAVDATCVYWSAPEGGIRRIAKAH